MHIFSRIVEVDQVLCDLEVPDTYMDDAEVKDYSRHFKDGETASYEIKALYVPGLFIQKTQVQTIKEITDDFLTSGKHIRFFFYLKGHSFVRRGAGNQDYEHAEGMLLRNYLDKSGGGSLVHIPGNDEMKYVVIKMSREFYIQLLKDEQWINNDAFHQYILAGDPENRPNETLYVDMRTLQILQEILHCDHIQQYRYHFLKLKLRELLFIVHQLTHFGPANHSEPIASDVGILEKIRAYLILHLDKPPSVTELSKMFMLNEKKLKQDFKSVYGNTIYAFVIDARMRKAKKLLFEDHNVNELAMLLGYQSVSHFIKVFKTYHGCTPKEALSKFKALTSATQKGRG